MWGEQKGPSIPPTAGLPSSLVIAAVLLCTPHSSESLAPCSRSGRSVRSTLSSFKKVPGWEPIVELLKRHPVRLPKGVSPKDRQVGFRTEASWRARQSRADRSTGCRMPTYIKGLHGGRQDLFEPPVIKCFSEAY